MRRPGSTFALVLFFALAWLGSCDARAETKSAKIHMCESTDLYFGPVQTGTSTARLAETCRDVSTKVASKAINACAAQEASACEVLYSADRKTLLIEHKIQVSKGGSK